MNNHLGNVLATISDKKIAVPQATPNQAQIHYYNADVITANDYYPGGMQMPGRVYSQTNTKYRYGFNGKENDNDIKGEGNQQDYGMRIYDPRLGRFLSVDPITKDYPELTPYQFASNRPIDGIDQDGLEYAKSNMHSDATVVRHNSDPNVALKQIHAAPDRDRKVIAAFVQNKVKTQAGTVMTRYKEPDAVQQQRNETLQKNHDATVIPANHWTRNTHLNKASENLAEPMAYAAIGEGAGQLLTKGLSIVLGGAAKGGQSLGAGRTAVKQWLQNAGNLERGTLIRNIESTGFKLTSKPNSPVSVFERGDMRIRLDPPQGKTLYNHMHLEYGGNSYNIFLNPVNYKSPSAHIPIK